jgi:hypothetical protein
MGGGWSSSCPIWREDTVGFCCTERDVMLRQVGALLESELQKGGEDFTLLEQMNLVTTAKYRCAARF